MQQPVPLAEVIIIISMTYNNRRHIESVPLIVANRTDHFVAQSGCTDAIGRNVQVTQFANKFPEKKEKRPKRQM